MTNQRPKPVSLEAEIAALTRLVEKENRRMLSPIVGDVRSAVEAGYFELAMRHALTARRNALRLHIAIPNTVHSSEVAIFFHTVYWWAQALIMLKAAERHTGRWNLCRPYLRWRAACIAQEAYRARTEVREQLF